MEKESPFEKVVLRQENLQKPENEAGILHYTPHED